MARRTEEQKRQLAALDREFEEKKSKILNPPKKGPALTTPENPAWTVELIARLKRYVDSGRYFVVNYNDNRVYGLDLVPEEYNDKYTPDAAEFYLQEYDDARPEGTLLSECDPTDFHVFLLKPVEWRMEDPNWNEADPESWAEYQRFQEASED